ncbi:Zn-dependent hydrolase [Paenalkalicoccus suaedae]|uniref:Zn-dependent hydrolase n=1 Tax=Paenalkalicoccus suaedae TaxID=2592382 RepID=A0A859FGE0_9BACI|nr:Zn-dependent hydrolase [Paenalkalicoccus suaedae]QKS72433.1 Zn-dependent hydrolase [Paenalkalicoccus suaedae]
MTTYINEFYEKLLTDYDYSLDRNGVSGERLARRLQELAKIGLTQDNGSNRLAFSPEEKAAKELVATWMKEAGLDVRTDGAGNVIGRLEGASPKTILSGSHVDSVPNGGHFDGPLGVLAALEVAEAIRASGNTPAKSYEVVIFSDEEGARFQGGMTGSKAFTRELEFSEEVDRRDSTGTSFDDVLRAQGLSLTNATSINNDLSLYDAYVEIHIEQGKRLEKAGLSVGVVTGIAGPTWLQITFTGEAGHAGNTPMNDRRDPLVAAGAFVSKLPNIPGQISDSAVATVGRLEVHPNGSNVIPGSVTCTVDMRDITVENKVALKQAIEELLEETAATYGIEVSSFESTSIAPLKVADDLQQTVGAAITSELGVEPMYIPSGAGHDAMIIGKYMPMAMIFVQSKDGVSHNPKEWTTLTDCVSSVHVLKHVVESFASKET